MTDNSGMLRSQRFSKRDPDRSEVSDAPRDAVRLCDSDDDRDATVPAKKPRYATAALFYGYPATLIAEVLCVTRQTAYHFKSGIRRPGPTSMRLWHLYVSGRILGDEWEGWQARDGALFDPEGHRTTQAQLRAYAYVWQLARELARGDPIATEALDQYASMAMARMDRARKRRGAGASVATARPAALEDRTVVKSAPS